MPNIIKLQLINKNLLPEKSLKTLICKDTNVKAEDKMAVGYKEMAEINLQLSEICFAAESEVEKIFKQERGE